MVCLSSERHAGQSCMYNVCDKISAHLYAYNDNVNNDKSVNLRNHLFVLNKTV